MKTAVFGASGYGGQVLMRLLLDHPEVDAVLPVSSSAVGSPVDERDSGLGPDVDGKLPAGRAFLSREEALGEAPDAVFAALPPGSSAEFAAPFFGKSVVFDLSADFRLRNRAVHEQTYGFTAPYPERRNHAVYGLAEHYRTAVARADIIAVPGCFPTCILLPLLPLAAAGIPAGPVIANAITGISGAGRKAKETSLFVERSENAVAYNPGTMHRHVPEMSQEIAAAGCDAPLLFIPHLVPLRRGMEATVTVPVSLPAKEAGERAASVLEAAYGNEPFIRLVGARIPATRDVVGSNRCDIGWKTEAVGPGDSVLILFSVTDNLMKGAAGQAVQDFNIRFGFNETSGLPLRGIA